MKPSAVSRMRRAAPANISSGNAVTAPPAISSRSIFSELPKPPLPPYIQNQATAPSATGDRITVSAVSPGIDPTGANLRTSPYIPKLKASARLIHSVSSAPAARMATPIMASSSATKVARVIPSFRKK